jgi:choline dehydrogenase
LPITTKVKQMNEQYDVVVVGGGSAGCIVAARMSENPARSVLLLEAGPDYATAESVPAGVLEARYNPMRGQSPDPDPKHDWGLSVKGKDGATIAAPQGHLIGGGSAVNAMMSIRGVRTDHEEWAELGNPSWGWDEALAAYRELEDDSAPSSKVHGRGGPWTVTRHHPAEYGPLQAAFVESCRNLGIQDAWDLNAPGAEGVGPIPMSRFGTKRISTAAAYLNPARHRKNLSVRGDSLVARVLFDGDVVIGVELADGTHIGAGEVILCSGAILTPAVLQRSGVGPAKILNSLGIEAVANLPVGENLFDHVSVPLLAKPREGAWNPDHFSMQTAVRTSTTVQPGTFDAQLTMFSYLNARTTGEGVRGLAGEGATNLENVAGIGTMLHKPRATGTVEIVSTDPTVLPAVDPNYLGHPTDVASMREIVRMGWKVLTAEPLASLLGEPLSMNAATIADDDALDHAIEGMVAAVYHFNGTCKMASKDQGGVVDEAGNVYGLKGLRVADASVIPTSPGSNTMLPTIMVAERISAFAGKSTAATN